MKILGIIFIIAGIGGIIQLITSAGQTASSIGFSIGSCIGYLLNTPSKPKEKRPGWQRKMGTRQITKIITQIISLITQINKIICVIIFFIYMH